MSNNTKRLIIEPKLPSHTKCGCCGNKMDFVNEFIGYSCRTEGCPLQVAETELEVA